MIKIYKYGCATCGVDGVYVRRVKAYAKQHQEIVEIVNSKYDELGRTEHAEYLKSKGLDSDAYHSIVVYNGEVWKLRSWNF